MPALAFGLKPAKPQLNVTKPPQKRKAVFDDEPQDDADEDNAFSRLQKPKPKVSRLKPLLDDDPDASRASARVQGTETSTPNLSALRSAKLHDAEASKIDSSVYDYDAVYDTFHAPKEKQKAEDELSGPKYMTSLLQSADVRKRDLQRAKDKLLQRERDAEGDEFADKEKFVTSAYKKQQEENRLLEEEEKKREQQEEERKRKGGGMTDFNKNLLRREEERQQEIAKALEEAKKRKEAGEDIGIDEDMDVDENKMAADLNQQGGRIVVNDDGEVVDKRQLLGAGLNVAPKKPDAAVQTKKTGQSDKPQEWRRSEKAQDARMSQRERQTRMIERQIEEMEEKQRLADEAEQKAVEEKNKTKLTEESKMSAKERFLQRKKEREEQAKKDASKT